MSKAGKLAAAALCVCIFSGAAAAKVTTINVWFWNKDIQVVIDDFQRKNPDIRVKASIGDWGTFHDKLLSSMVAGSNVPDVTGIEISYMPRLVQGGGLFTCLDTFGAQKYKDKFVDFRWRLATVKGKLYAMPIDVGPIATWYRPATLAESGFPSDPASVASNLRSWEDLFTISKKMVRDINGDGKPDFFSLGNGVRIAEIMRQQLAGRVFDENLKVVMDNEDLDKWMAAWKMAKSFKDSGYESGFANRTDPNFQKALKSNRMAFVMEAVWNGVWIRPIQGQWGVAPLPTGIGANDGGSFLGIPAGAKHKKEAYKFLEFVTANTASQVELMEKAYWFPAYKTSYADPYFNEPAGWCSNQKYLQIFAQSAITTKYLPVTRHDEKAKTIVDQELQKVMAGKDVRAAIMDAAANIRRAARGAK